MIASGGNDDSEEGAIHPADECDKTLGPNTQLIVLVLVVAEVNRNLDLAALVDVVDNALLRQAADKVELERPQRPHFTVGAGLDDQQPIGTGIAMPAYVYGVDHYATKLVGVHEDNEIRDFPTINAQVVLTPSIAASTLTDHLIRLEEVGLIEVSRTDPFS